MRKKTLYRKQNDMMKNKKKNTTKQKKTEKAIF